MSADPALDRVWRDERPRIVGSLARRFGDLALAEDAAQEAFAAAARRWPLDGVPVRPGAWLTTTAYRKAIGMLRAHRPTVDLSAVGASGLGAADVADAADGVDVVTDDDLFALVLTCCHPALNPDARVALTLRHVCGLSVAEIAAGFLVAEATMAKRLVRARDKIRQARIPFEPPSGAALDQRLDEVRAVIYAVFNEGYLASGEQPAVRVELCEEAIWLARHLRQLRPDDESAGLYALLLVQHARRHAREDVDGHLVPFHEQDRGAWDRAAIEEARRVMAVTSQRSLGPYQVEAAIALLHVADGGPRWPSIADLYGILARLAPSPVVQINRAVAVGEADGASAGLAVLAPLLADSSLATHAPLHAAHAHLLERSGDPQGAAAAWRRGIATAANPQQQAAMRVRLDAVTSARS